MNIGLKIKELRNKNNMTQEELAEKLNISDKAISRWENQNTFPDITLLPLIADIFSVSIDCLFDRNTPGEKIFENEIGENLLKLANNMPYDIEIGKNTSVIRYADSFLYSTANFKEITEDKTTAKDYLQFLSDDNVLSMIYPFLNQKEYAYGELRKIADMNDDEYDSLLDKMYDKDILTQQGTTVKRGSNFIGILMISDGIKCLNDKNILERLSRIYEL